LFNPLGGGQIALLAIILLSSYVMCCLPCCLACCMDDVKGEQRKAHTYHYPPTYKFPIIIILLCACTYITLLSVNSGIVDHTGPLHCCLSYTWAPLCDQLLIIVIVLWLHVHWAERRRVYVWLTGVVVTAGLYISVTRFQPWAGCYARIRIGVSPCRYHVVIWQCETFSFLMQPSAMSIGGRVCTSREDRTGWSEQVSVLGWNRMAASGFSCRMPLVGTGWAIPLQMGLENSLLPCRASISGNEAFSLVCTGGHWPRATTVESLVTSGWG